MFGEVGLCVARRCNVRRGMVGLGKARFEVEWKERLGMVRYGKVRRGEVR